eukprot:16052-Heterococcus_DN1.PRE.2
MKSSLTRNLTQALLPQRTLQVVTSVAVKQHNSCSSWGFGFVSIVHSSARLMYVYTVALLEHALYESTKLALRVAHTNNSTVALQQHSCVIATVYLADTTELYEMLIFTALDVSSLVDNDGRDCYCIAFAVRTVGVCDCDYSCTDTTSTTALQCHYMSCTVIDTFVHCQVHSATQQYSANAHSTNYNTCLRERSAALRLPQLLTATDGIATAIVIAAYTAAAMLLLLLLATTQWSHMQRAARCVSIGQRSDFEHPREPLHILHKQAQNNNSNQKAKHSV